MTMLRGLPARARLPDAALAVLVMAIVGMMIIPLPTGLLDLLIAGNIAVSLLMLLVSLQAGDGLAFAAMPTVLLITTLYRLALNVSSTRLILLQADAGEVIAAFGNFVVRGDYVVGGVIFLILTLIQFLVIARGSERVAEVGARFTLDAIPGKQLAIDADLRSGLVGPEQARQLRHGLARESQFYGAMDGAMKFVKGDAIAGVVITGINLLAGIGIGMGARDMALLDALQTYGLLTIGDGLCSQLPALLISTSAGVLVTRVAGEDRSASLAGQVGQQLFGDKQTLRSGALFLLGLALMPGLPGFPFLALAAMILALSMVPTRVPRDKETQEQLPKPPEELSLEITGAALVSRRAELSGALAQAAGKLRNSLGIPVPECALQTMSGGRNGYRLLIRGTPIAAGPCDSSSGFEGAVTTCQAALVTHAAAFLDLHTVQRLVDALEGRQPARVRHLVPQPIALVQLQWLLQRLVAERISIRSLGDIMEAAAGALNGRAGLDDERGWYERVRVKLGRQITHGLAMAGLLRVHPLDPTIEEILDDAGQTRGSLALPPSLARDIVDAVRKVRDGETEDRCVLITGPRLRPVLHELLAPELPEVQVISYPEVAPDLTVEYTDAVGA